MWSTLLVLYLLFAPQIHSVQWCYQNLYLLDEMCSEPSQWVKEFPVCGGQKQSPINIVTSKARHDPNLSSIIFEGYTEAINVTVQNFGNSGAVLVLPPSVRIQGGDLPATYKAIQLHFHWGVDHASGSEHTINGEQYAMELHIVHIKEQYNSLKEAKNDTVGIAVLGFFYEVSTKENQKFNQVIEAFGRIPYPGNISTIPEFRLTDILPSLEKLSSYYRYMGSLTTPGCDEAIIWTVFQETFPISQQQVDNINKQMWFDVGIPMTANFRPVQKINGRIVYKSRACCSTSSGSVILCLSLLYIVVLFESILM